MARMAHLLGIAAVGLALTGCVSTEKYNALKLDRDSLAEQLSKSQAEGFYAVHRERPFFNSLVTFMTEGPVIVMALEREDAVKKLREAMGATNPANADAGTIRKLYAESIERNSIHGSDAPETAAEELKYFFTTQELNQI